jgi:GTP cyclohydrolase I
MYSELFSGIGVDAAEVIDAVFEDEDTHGGLVRLKDIPFHSICEHHLLPFFGRANIAYIPKGKVAGASKLVRALETIAKRPQLQERMTQQLADAIHKALEPDGVAVLLEAEHLCMAMRGVRKVGSSISTSAVRGSFWSEETSRGMLLASLGLAAE